MWFVLSVLFLLAFGIVVIIRRDEVTEGIAMFMGASTLPGCAVALGASLVLLALAAVVLNRLGLIGAF